jgi:hypothetical protein
MSILDADHVDHIVKLSMQMPKSKHGASHRFLLPFAMPHSVMPTGSKRRFQTRCLSWSKIQDKNTQNDLLSILRGSRSIY